MAKGSGSAQAAGKAAKSPAKKAAQARTSTSTRKPVAENIAKRSQAKTQASTGKSHQAKKQAPLKASEHTPAGVREPQPDLYSSLHALLHTMRLIERHDEPLCSMHDELKRTGKLSAGQRRRLQQLVDELPAEDYQADLETLRRAVAA